MITAHDLTYGVEIETLANERATRAGLCIGNYHHGRLVPYLPDGWRAEYDGSLHSSRAGYSACEIVSPILQGEDGIRQIIETCAALRGYGHKVNDTCGVHIHIGWNNDWSNHDPRALARLVSIVSYAERGIFASTGTKSRERGHYCCGLRGYGNAENARRRASGYRYHLLNLTRLGYYGQSTVEFRAFSGSMNATKISAWAQVCIGIVQRALTSKRAPMWEPKPLRGGLRKRGIGQSELERLFCYLAWGAGYSRLHNGTQFGHLGDNYITLDECKSVLRRMALKYDNTENQ